MDAHHPQCFFFSEHIKHGTEVTPVFSPTFLSEKTLPWILFASSTTTVEQCPLTVFSGVLGPRN